MFQITSAEDVNKLLRKHNYDILIDLAKSCDDDEYGKAVLNRLMKDLMNTKVGELLRELLKKGASLEAKAKPGPKPGAKRKASPAPAPTSPGRKPKAAVAEPRPRRVGNPNHKRRWKKKKPGLLTHRLRRSGGETHVLSEFVDASIISF
jgi:hypothetical protein